MSVDQPHDRQLPRDAAQAASLSAFGWRLTTLLRAQRPAGASEPLLPMGTVIHRTMPTLWAPTAGLTLARGHLVARRFGRLAKGSVLGGGGWGTTSGRSPGRECGGDGLARERAVCTVLVHSLWVSGGWTWDLRRHTRGGSKDPHHRSVLPQDSEPPCITGSSAEKTTWVSLAHSLWITLWTAWGQPGGNLADALRTPGGQPVQNAAEPGDDLGIAGGLPVDSRGTTRGHVDNPSVHAQVRPHSVHRVP
jgi:hypothetical protein